MLSFELALSGKNDNVISLIQRAYRQQDLTLPCGGPPSSRPTSGPSVRVPDNFLDQLEAPKDALAEAEVMAADFAIERYASPDGSVKEGPRITVGGLSGDVY
jgi:hypothetical protein